MLALTAAVPGADADGLATGNLCSAAGATMPLEVDPNLCPAAAVILGAPDVMPVGVETL